MQQARSTHPDAPPDALEDPLPDSNAAPAPSRRRRTIPTNVLIPVAHRDALKRLARRTRVSQSEYLREAVADLLDKYRSVLDDEAAAARAG